MNENQKYLQNQPKPKGQEQKPTTKSPKLNEGNPSSVDI